MRYWKFNCSENNYPGLWRLWFASQCVAVGWPPPDFSWNGATSRKPWARARNSLKKMRPGDEVIVQLRGNRVARVGAIVKVRAKDDDWKAFVPEGSWHRNGEMGRRVEVRWDLDLGPSDRDSVVHLPPNCRFNKGQALTAIAEIPAPKFRRIKEAMRDEETWVSLLGQTGHEVLLSDYIATFPHLVGDGLQPYPFKKLREKVFKGHSGHLRSDVLLMDRAKRPVVVECKRGIPIPDDVEQLRKYLRAVKNETRKKPSGILVHGGAAKLSDEVRSAVRRLKRQGFPVEVQRYELNVKFAPCR